MDTLKLLSRSSGLKLGQKQREHVPALPSEGVNNHVSIEAEPGSKKRKRNNILDSHYELLDERAIRQIQKQHNIRIMDVRALYSEDSFESRKARKESSRSFPQPLQSFSQFEELGVSQVLRSNVINQGYKEPTAVQVATIPLLLRSGREEPDLLTVAPTGSGKTLAFLIPLINKIVNHRSTEEDRKPRALILAPTKELVTQIVNEGRKMAANTGVSIADLRKGMKMFEKSDGSAVEESGDESDQETDDKGSLVKADILVSTPLSLKNAITISSSETIISLPHVRTLILDEADVLLDPLFREQTLAIWSACTSPDLRCSLWSATIGSSIEELSTATINRHYKVTTPVEQTPPPLLRTVIGLKDTSLPSISHRLIYASTEPGKLMGIRQLLHPASSASKLGKQDQTSPPILRPPFLVFTQSIDRAQSLYKELQYDIPPSAGGSTRIAVLHSSLSSKQRSDTMTSFRLGKIWILITTDLLSRGVDFRGVNGVVNYDIPTTTASYVHRAGRTGRAGRNGGICVTLYTKDDVKYLKPIANIISASEKTSVTNADNTTSASVGGGLPDWLIPSLPHLTKQSKKDLKTRGVDVRRGIKESDNDKERKIKLKNRIGTTSGYDRKLEDRAKGMKVGSRRRKDRELQEAGASDEWAGLGD